MPHKRFPWAGKRKRTPTLGPISEGTLRSEDLLLCFADELKALRPHGYALLVKQAYDVARYLGRMDGSTKLPHAKPKVLAGCKSVQDVATQADDVLMDLENALSEHAPEYMYFGANEGDGACYGWWAAMDCIDQLDKFKHLSDVPSDYYGDFCISYNPEIIEVYTRFGNHRVKSLLRVV